MSDTIEKVITAFRELRNALYRILPEECPLKPHRALDPQMFMLSPELAKRGRLDREDICLFCRNTLCPYNSQVSKRTRRFLRLWLFGKWYGLPILKLLKSL